MDLSLLDGTEFTGMSMNLLEFNKCNGLCADHRYILVHYRQSTVLMQPEQLDSHT